MSSASNGTKTAKRWAVHTASKGTFYAQFLINATGPLSQPVIPHFEGQERFQGKTFHTNNWDHSYDYRQKRVAIVGSGASAAQVIPAIAPDVEHLHVFQRTPHWVLPRADRTFGRFQRWLLGLKPAYKLLRWMIYWQFETRVIAFKYSKPAIRMVQQHALRFLKRQVPDPELRRKLTPDYTIGCKRVIVSSTLYPALGRTNVTLHSREQGIAAIDETGIVTQDGQHIDLDLIVWSTGYDATDGVISYPVSGKNGTQLRDFWAAVPPGLPRHQPAGLSQPVYRHRPQHRHRPHVGAVHHRIADELHPRLHSHVKRTRFAQYRSAPRGRTYLH